MRDDATHTDWREVWATLWPSLVMVVIGLSIAGLILWAIAGCTPVVTPTPPESRTEALHLGVSGCAVTLRQNGTPVSTLTTNGQGVAPFIVTMTYVGKAPAPGTLNLAASATCAGYRPWAASWVAAPHGNQDVCAADTGCGPNQGLNLATPLVTLMPPAPTRDQIMASHDSFQGSVLHTAQFGDLNWWTPAFVSLNAADRAAYYAQARSWGDTGVTVAWKWDYGEAGQPYGSGQLVPPHDFTGDPEGFRAVVEDVILHGFIPRVFLSGDDGFDVYMARLPIVLAALASGADGLDLRPYAKLQVCYDSCIPGWAGATDDKTPISTALLATRQACPTCVIAVEFATGFSSQGDGDAFWQTDAGRAIDVVQWEGNTWPPNNWEQYWEILDRWLGPAYIRPPQQTSDPPAPFSATDGRYYLRNGTPRGPYGVECLEPFTYDWVRGRLGPDAAPAALAALRGLGCPIIDLPQ